MVNHTVKAKNLLGFRRCGVYWPFDPVLVDSADFTKDEWARLLTETELVIQPVEDTEPVIPEPVEDERRAAIIDAMHRMLFDDPGRDNQDLWTKSGKPEVRALLAITGLKITARERNKYWVTLA